MGQVPTAVVAAGGLVGGYGVARWTKKRPLGGAALAVAGGVAARQWAGKVGAPKAAALTGLYVAAFAGSHPLAKKVGAWPAVFGVAGVVALASWITESRD
ncbi:hypothetical protein [Streptomyces hiroshimensis]|uniref:Integral membrane protein n=1 Tax=Streptomyces hiroshimensis TaxID=66424 RepID=A0ABQ2Z635_9ACTN|nr:hypothetical protein [Streptomyces hiroshimensis]GGY04513.1 hypothetical protein GCM10010324_59010 [Streptomyces hiroshimensis]